MYTLDRRLLYCRLSNRIWVSQVVKIRTDDKAKTVVEPGFVEACSKSKIVVEGE